MCVIVVGALIRNLKYFTYIPFYKKIKIKSVLRTFTNVEDLEQEKFIHGMRYCLLLVIERHKNSC